MRLNEAFAAILGVAATIYFLGTSIAHQFKDDPIPTKQVSRQVGDLTETITVPLNVPADKAFPDEA